MHKVGVMRLFLSLGLLSTAVIAGSLAAAADQRCYQGRSSNSNSSQKWTKDQSDGSTPRTLVDQI